MTKYNINNIQKQIQATKKQIAWHDRNGLTATGLYTKLDRLHEQLVQLKQNARQELTFTFAEEGQQ